MAVSTLEQQCSDILMEYVLSSNSSVILQECVARILKLIMIDYIFEVSG